jgi:hypothetical protein
MGRKSSSSTSSNTTNNQDNRVAVQDGIGLSNSSGNTVNITDGGSVAAAFDFGTKATNHAFSFGSETVGRALQTVETSNATLGDGYSKLIDAAGDLFARGEGLIGQTQKAVADAYGQATADKAGGIDNRTIIVLAVAGAAAAAFIATRGKA